MLVACRPYDIEKHGQRTHECENRAYRKRPDAGALALDTHDPEVNQVHQDAPPEAGVVVARIVNSCVPYKRWSTLAQALLLVAGHQGLFKTICEIHTLPGSEIHIDSDALRFSPRRLFGDAHIVAIRFLARTDFDTIEVQIGAPYTAVRPSRRLGNACFQGIDNLPFHTVTLPVSRTRLQNNGQ
jgi:hypothetical protein